MNNSRNTVRTPSFAAGLYVMPAFVLSPGTMEALKWIAVAFMTMDHVNKFLLHDSASYLYAIGRLAMPIFTFILAYNLAQQGSFGNGVHFRVMRRLAVVAIIASVPYTALNTLIENWWPLNILFTLLVGTGLVALLESNIKHRNILALLLFIVGGAFVEFWWAGLAIFILSWRYVRSPNLLDLAGLMFTLFLLGNINGNQWAFVSLLVIFAAPFIEVKVPRIRHVLYAYYPLHLAMIWGICHYFPI